MRTTSRAIGAAAALAAILTATGCTGSSGGSTGARPAQVRTPSPTTTSGARHHAVNPYTGEGPVPSTPVIAVKIDDTAPGRPQLNIDKADIVYIEAVEGGLTRLAAIYGTNKPVVGYVRSTRPSDPELLLQFGKITEAYSGGARVSLQIRRTSGLAGWSNDAGNAYFTRVSRAASSYINVTLDLAKLAKTVKTPRPKSIGWTFARRLDVPSSSGTSVRTVVTGTYSHGTPVVFRYDSKIKRYVRYIDGVAQRAADGKLISAKNVIVQSCKVTLYTADRDVLGNPAQYTHTVGSGPVAVFRDGRRINGTWSRPRTSAGTTLRNGRHQPIPLDPGNTWVVLIRRGIAVG